MSWVPKGAFAHSVPTVCTGCPLLGPLCWDQNPFKITQQHQIRLSFPIFHHIHSHPYTCTHIPKHTQCTMAETVSF